MKTFVIDTNVLLHDPEAVLRFEGNQVVIPVTVIEELDKMKRFRDELGRNARAAIRLLDALKEEGEGDLHRGVKVDGISVRIQLEMKTSVSPGLALSINENKIIMAAYLLHEQGEQVVFISKDFSARVKAEAVGIVAEDYRYYKVDFETIHRGLRRVEVEKGQVDNLLKSGKVELEEQGVTNEYCEVESPDGSKALGKFSDGKLELLPPEEREVWGIKPLNLEQRCALDLLMREDISLVTLVGPAGTGKTLMALAAGLRKVFDDAVYGRILVSRPIMPLGKDIGYLPGTKEEKLVHWMQPIYDNLEFLCESSGPEPSDTFRYIVDNKKIEMEAVTYIRGRSLPKMYMIIDEAQNLTPHEIKTIISRAGKGTKVVLTGDPTQIDNPYLDKDSNGLTYTVSRFRGQPLFGHVYLDKTERSELAALAAEVM
jgi:PhoH-like ATPase